MNGSKHSPCNKAFRASMAVRLVQTDSANVSNVKHIRKNILIVLKMWPAAFIPNEDDINVIQTRTCIK